MEARGRSRKSTRRINATHQIRAWMSMVLTAVMIIGNMATSVNTVSAATPAPREEFQIRAKDIQKAAEKALDKGEAISKEILISGKDENVVKEYEKLFAADGKLYELNLTKETGTVKGVDGVDLRVFMRLPEEADPKTHVLNGEEELYFVYINDGEESISARLNIDGLISGFSTVRAYEAVFGDEEEKDGESASGGSVLGNGSGAGDESGKLSSEEAKQDSETADENVNPGEESKGAGREEEGEAVNQDEESIEAVQDHESRAEETAAGESREEIMTETSDKQHPTESAAASEEGKADEKENEGSRQEEGSQEENNKEDNQEVNGKKENNSAEADRKEDNGEVSGNQGNDSKADDSKENGIKENDSKENDSKGNSSEVSSDKDNNHGQESEKAVNENKDGEKSADKAEAGNKSGSERSASDKDKSSGSEQSGADKDKSSGSEQSGSDKDKSSGSDKTTEKDSSKEEKSGAKDDKASSGNDHKEDSKSGDSKSSDSKSENSSAKEVSINSLQISPHQILRVAEPEDISAEEIEASEVSEPEEETENEEEPEIEEPETEEESEIETEPKTEEESETEKETEVLIETEAETEAVTGETAETESKAEAMTEETAEMEAGSEAVTEEAAEAVAEATTGETAEIVAAGAEAVTGETTETETVFDAEEEIWEEDELAEIEGNQTPVEETDPFKKRGVLEGKVLNLVAFEDGLTARAFVTTLEKLGMNKEDLIEGGHILTYTISPAGSAVVVNAPELVRDESEVIFGVTPQVGYRVFEVTANGEMLEKVNPENLANASNAEKVNEDYVKEDTKYFRIPSVLESQDIEITLKEITEGTHPAFRESKTVNGVTVTVSAGENILPEGTYLTVEEVTEKVEEAVKENVKAEKGTEVQTVIAYDINLMLDGKKLSNASWSGNYVNVEFSGERIEELKQNGESIEVAPLETPTQIVEAADGEVETLPLLEDVTAEDIRVNEDEITRIQEDEGDSIDSIQVRAEHFTVWAIIGNSGWDTGNLKRVDANVNVNVYREADAGETAAVTINGSQYVSLGTGDVTFPVNTSNDSSVSALGIKTISVEDINLALSGITSVDDKTTVHPTNVYYKNGNSTYLITDFSVTQSRINNVITTTITGTYNNDNNRVTSAAFATLNTTISLNTDKTVNTETTTETNNASRFYWIIDRPNVNLHKVEWYVNGELDKVTYVGDGETPIPPYFEGEPEAIRGKLTSSSKQTGNPSFHNFINSLNFKGWALEPNSKDYHNGTGLSVDTSVGVTRYYAVFSYKTLFYVLLPQSTETGNKKDYTYVGPQEDPTDITNKKNVTTGVTTFGEVIVPDKFDRRESREDIESLIISGPTESSINKGLDKYYGRDENWSYQLSWSTLTVSLASNGYTIKGEETKPPVIDRTTLLHVDGMVTLLIDNSVNIGYEVVYPDKDAETVSVKYTKDAQGNFSTIPIISEANKEGKIQPHNADKAFPEIYVAGDGTIYRFDGWYEDKYVNKAPSSWSITGPKIFYAHYVAVKGSFSVKKILEDGTSFSSSKVEDVEFQLYSTDENWSKDSEVYKPIGDVVTMTAGTANVDTEKRTKFGTFTFSNLAPGYYYLHEVKTAPGYKLLEEDIKIEIIVQEDGTVNCYYYNTEGQRQGITNNVLEVTNEPAYTAVLPDTGGPGLGLIKEFGWVLLLLALMMAGMEVQYYGERRKRIQVDEI